MRPAPKPAIREIGVGDLKRLGIDDSKQLYWDGKPIELRRRLDLTAFQKTVTAIVTLCAVLGAIGGFVTGFNNATVFLCARNLQWLSCPSPAVTSNSR